ncbi:MAG: hypothetical protein JWO73_609 [Candidatus Taylorbacteria bacterium]|nr:hypothetical protein [Candidatus Taylorbacteria bacterium]
MFVSVKNILLLASFMPSTIVGNRARKCPHKICVFFLRIHILHLTAEILGFNIDLIYRNERNTTNE